MRFAALIAAVVLGAAGARAVQPQVEGSKPPAAEDTALLKQLEEINTRTVRIADLSAEFEQKKFTPLLKNPMVSTGMVKVRGAVVRWDTMRPEPSMMRIDERELRIYYPSHKVMEIYPIGESMQRLSSSPLPRLASIRKEFSFTRMDPRALAPSADASKVIGVVMTPIVGGIREHVQTVKVVIDIAGGYATHMEITDADGERTLMIFSNIRTNSGMPEADVALEAPAGVRIVRPLSGGGDRP